jgi:hypothetical protein
MSKTNEYKLFQLLKNNLKNTHFTRIESHTELGIPDVNACHNGQEVWLELKANSRKDLGLSKYQIVWMKKRIKHGGNVWIMNRPLLDKTLRIYSPSTIDPGSLTSVHEQPTLVLGPTKINWDQVMDLLFPAPAAR